MRQFTTQTSGSNRKLFTGFGVIQILGINMTADELLKHGINAPTLIRNAEENKLWLDLNCYIPSEKVYFRKSIRIGSELVKPSTGKFDDEGNPKPETCLYVNTKTGEYKYSATQPDNGRRAYVGEQELAAIVKRLAGFKESYKDTEGDDFSVFAPILQDVCKKLNPAKLNKWLQTAFEGELPEGVSLTNGQMGLEVLLTNANGYQDFLVGNSGQYLPKTLIEFNEDNVPVAAAWSAAKSRGKVMEKLAEQNAGEYPIKASYTLGNMEQVGADNNNNSSEDLPETTGFFED